MFFYNILVRKNASLGFKNKRFKKSKNSDFSKGVNPWFWSKNGHFSNVFFNQSFWSKNGHFSKFYFLVYIGQKNVFYDIL